MIKEFATIYQEHSGELLALFSEKTPSDYKEIVTECIKFLVRHTDEEWDIPDPDRVHEIDDGDYQGTLVYVIGGKGYQPSHYWYVRVYYGSCSGCDTLEAIRGYDDDKPTEEQAKEYLTLAMHVIQNLKKMDGEAA